MARKKNPPDRSESRKGIGAPAVPHEGEHSVKTPSGLASPTADDEPSRTDRRKLVTRVVLGSALAALTGALALKTFRKAGVAGCTGEGVCSLCPAVWDCRLPGSAEEKEKRRRHFKGSAT